MIKLLTLCAAALSVVNGFYLPGVAPHNYKSGETVDLKVNKLRWVLLLDRLLSWCNNNMLTRILFDIARRTLSCLLITTP